MSQFILAAFDGAENTSRIVIECVETYPNRKVLLPNDKLKSVEVLTAAIKRYEPACVILMGQRPVVCNKIAVEKSAKLCGEVRSTNMDVASITELIKGSGYDAYISGSCGTSYCNHIYWHALGMGVNTVFLHVPYKKNVSDINALVKAVQAVTDGLAGVPALL